MDDPGRLPPEMLERYKAACDKLVPKLAMLHGLFRDIAAGKADWGLAHTEQCIECELEAMLEELRNALDRNYTPPRDCDF